MVDDTRRPAVPPLLDDEQQHRRLLADAVNAQVQFDKQFHRYFITSPEVSSSSGSITLDLVDGQVFATTLTENITTVTMAGLPESGIYTEWLWIITQDSTARTVTFPAAWKFPGGTAPTISTGSGDIDLVYGRTRDNGTTILGSFEQAFA